MNHERFLAAFQVTRTIVFEVEYGAITSNKEWHFSTGAAQFNRPKTDFNHCGQAQNDLLPHGSAARRFWKKWNEHHIKNLTAEEYAEMRADMEALKVAYNYIEKCADHPSHYISFHELKTLSMLPVKKVTQ